MMKPWSVLMLLLVCGSSAARYSCERKPSRTVYPPTDFSGLFELTLYDNQVKSEAYMPAQQYEVTLKSNAPELHFFTEIMVWPEGETMQDPQNPHKIVVKDGGTMRVHEKFSVKMSERCDNTIEMLSMAPSTYVQMYWVSPAKNNGCVTLHAMVAENDEVWYRDGDGLMIRVCEDNSTFSDISEGINENCEICEEAKYELKFEGQWSRNTHPHKFPKSDWSVYYSDLIGASHSDSYIMWKDGSPPSDAMRMFALNNDTATIEEEILNNYGTGYIRTLIKGKGHGPRNGGDMNAPTYALVRVDRKHHLISTATAIRPSPDWFLGISNYELCSVDAKSWPTYINISLRPWDAGVNGGISFESSPLPTNESIGRVKVGSFTEESPFYNMNFKQVKPFAALTIRLIRTYPTECKEETENLGAEEGEGGNEQEPEPEPATARRTSPLPQDVVESNNSGGSAGEGGNPNDDCPLSGWDKWTHCSSECGTGYRSRSRYHLVNGVEYRYYKEGEISPRILILKPSDDCLERQKDAIIETELCEGSCFNQPQPLVASAYKSNRAISRQGRTTATSGAEEVQNCVMSAWSRWAACSGSCGEGRQLRARNVIREPRNGGNSCPKNVLEVRKCMLHPCPVL